MASEHDDDLLDIISDAIDESMDVDWTSRDGARHVLGALQIGGYIRTAAMDALIADSADLLDDHPLTSNPVDVSEAANMRDNAASADALGEVIAELQLAAFLAGRGSVTSMKHGTRTAKPAPTMDDFRRMALATAALSAMSPAGEVEKIVAWLRSKASIEHRHGPAITRDAFMRDVADAIERGDYRHD